MQTVYKFSKCNDQMITKNVIINMSINIKNIFLKK